MQDEYTLHKSLRRPFPRNRYTVNNILDVWECDLIDVQSLSRFNDNHKNLLTVIDVFSKLLHIVTLKSKMGPTVTSAFQSILKDPKYSTPLRRRPIWVRTKAKNFLINIYKTCWNVRIFSFMYVEIPTWIAVSSRGRTVRFVISYTNISPIKIPTDKMTFFHNLSTLTMILFTPLLAWRHQKSLIQTYLRYGRK